MFSLERMAKYLGFYLILVMLRLAMAFAGILNETCYEDDDTTGGPLRADEYQDSCPPAEAIVFSGVEKAVFGDPRMAASLLRLHFHDCFVNASPSLIFISCAGPLPLVQVQICSWNIHK